MRALLLGLALLIQVPTSGVAAAQGDTGGLAIELSCAESRPVFGQAFTLVVHRTWPSGLVPEPFDEEALAPLALVELAVERGASGGLVSERRSYRAQAFLTGTLRIPGPTLSAAPEGGGALRVAIGEPLLLEVRTALGPGDGPDPEPPAALLPLPRPLGAWPWLTALAVVTVVLLLHRRGVARRQDPGAAPEALALAGLEVLAASAPVSFAERRADAYAGAALLRRYVSARFGLAAAASTSSELARDPLCRERLDEDERRRLLTLLGRLETVEYAGLEDDDEARRDRLASARGFIEACRPALEEVS